jgi:tellurite resistance protein
LGGATWIPAGTSITLAGAVIPGGLLYFGSSLPTLQGAPDPALVNPQLSVAARGDYTQPLNYWPSYSQLDPVERRAYINWLVGKRSDPKADIGYVFLFFYGLERRAVVDVANDDRARADLPAIVAEVRRLLEVYGGQSHSFKRYANALLDWTTSFETERLYERPVPTTFGATFELPFYVRLALGQAVKDGVPIPAQLALAWVKYGNFVSFRTAATRCPVEFDRLFIDAYQAKYGPGMPLSRNRTKLKFIYRPASSGLQGYKEMTQTFDETPDVSVLKAPTKVLTALVEEATERLDSFSRYVGKTPGTSKTLQALVHLPVCAWPIEAVRVLDSLRARLTEGPAVLTLNDLLGSWDCKEALAKDKTELLAQAFADEKIGMEPDVLAGAKVPKPDDHVALFALEASKESSRAGAPYRIAALTLQLASAVAAADGDFSRDEAEHLKATVRAWGHLEASQTQRLLASVDLLRASPASLVSLTKKLEPLERSVKEAIAQCMATVAQADGVVSPDEVRMLERIYKALGLDSQAVFSNVHAAATGASLKTSVATTALPKGQSARQDPGFKLDLDRIAALQKDTDRVSNLLANIFADADAPTTPPQLADAEPAETPAAPPTAETAPAGLAGLDETHASLARLLLSRPEWTRSELEDVAADLDLMLDGALEHINDAAFDAHDMPLVEGDDLVTINPEFLEKAHA